MGIFQEYAYSFNFFNIYTTSYIYICSLFISYKKEKRKAILKRKIQFFFEPW